MILIYDISKPYGVRPNSKCLLVTPHVEQNPLPGNILYHTKERRQFEQIYAYKNNRLTDLTWTITSSISRPVVEFANRLTEKDFIENSEIQILLYMFL